MHNKLRQVIGSNEDSRTKLIDKIFLLRRQERVTNRSGHRQIGVNSRLSKILKEYEKCKYTIKRTRRLGSDFEESFEI